MYLTREDVYRAIRQIAKDKQQFQSREIREHLQVDTSEGNAVTSIHNWMKSLERSGLIEEVETGRKRNKLFRLSTPEASADTNIQGPTPVVPRKATALERLTQIEQAVANIEKQNRVLETKLDKLLRTWT